LKNIEQRESSIGMSGKKTSNLRRSSLKKLSQEQRTSYITPGKSSKDLFRTSSTSKGGLSTMKTQASTTAKKRKSSMKKLKSSSHLSPSEIDELASKFANIV
jgi:hypothetical protein